MPRPVDHIAFHARLSPDRLAAADLIGGRTWSYARLDRDVGACAAVLLEHGIQRGDRVAALARNRVTLIVLHHACARIGAMYAPLNWRLAASELAELVADIEPALLVEDDGVDRGVPALAIDALEAEIAVAEPAVTPPIDPDAASLILYTSGTSGRPKGAMLSERAIGETAINLSLLGAIDRNSRFLCDGPMFHVIGIVSTIRPPLMWGGACLVSDGFVSARTLARLSDPSLAITHFFGVPQMTAALRAEPGFDPAKLRHLTGLFTGGAPHAPADVTRWIEDGIPLSNGFGMSECGTVCHTPLDPRLVARHAGSVGTPTSRVAMRVVDEAGIALPPGERGELLLKGANLFSGYWRRPEAMAEAFTADGWFRTGDIARIDADGFVWLVDRKKDMFISGGENVYPAEIEAALADMPGVVEHAVLGLPDARWGEVGHVALVCDPGRVVLLADVLAQLDGRIARYKLPKSVSLHETLPRSGSGKVLKRVLRALLAERPS